MCKDYIMYMYVRERIRVGYFPATKIHIIWLTVDNRCTM